MIGVRGKPPSCGVIGCGFVGGAVIEAFKHYTDLKAYDKNKDMGFDYEDVINQDVLFVSLPTPMKGNGEVDLSILDGALEKISTNLLEGITGKPVLIKSTVPPGACREFQDKFSNLTIMFNPEFLTERTANLDFIQQSRIILGVECFPGAEIYPQVDIVTELFEARFPGVRIAFMDWDSASLVKYFTNVFFSVKVSLFNEFEQIAGNLGLVPNGISEELLNDGRIGRSHWQVPGHDGKRGFGGSCFPKDINGYITLAKKMGVDPLIGEAAWAKNIEVRPERDWESLKGRAVSDEN
jgi:UDPglucose 6-dehydrogenase